MTEHEPTGAAPTTDSGLEDDPVAVDAGGFDDVVAEIIEEAKRRRANGAYSTETLERLDAEFDRFAPLTFRRTGIDGAIRAVESASFINVEVPTGASRKPFAMVKQLIKKSTAWYHLHIARQVTTLGIQMTRPLRMLADSNKELERRISALEEQGSVVHARVRNIVEGRPTPRLVEASTGPIVDALGGLRGRVALCGASSALSDSVVAAHADTYVIAPTEAIDELIETRPERVADHLAAIADDTLAAVVVAGPVVESTSNPHRMRIVEHAVRSVAPGGRVVIAATDPATWGSMVDPVVADLAGGRPWADATWSAVLQELGCRSVSATGSGNMVVVVGSIA